MAITVIAQPLRTSLRSQTTTTATSPPREKERPTDRDRPVRTLQEESITASFDPRSAGRVSVETGDRLTLVVEVDRPSEISIPDLGLAGFADPYAPARFDILPRDPGRFPVYAVPGGRSGVIEVSRATRPGKP